MNGVVCPNCGSMARHRLIPYSINHFGLNFNNSGLLHIGANFDEVTFVLSRFLPCPYYRLDIYQKNFINLQGNLCQIPLADDCIDFCLIWHVLEHISEDQVAIQEMYRVLRNGGKLLVSVPIHPPGRRETSEDKTVLRTDYERIYGHHDHVRACGVDYANRFTKAGFHVETLDVKNIPLPDKQFFGLSDKHIAWCCTK